MHPAAAQLARLLLAQAGLQRRRQPAGGGGGRGLAGAAPQRRGAQGGLHGCDHGDAIGVRGAWDCHEERVSSQRREVRSLRRRDRATAGCEEATLLVRCSLRYRLIEGAAGARLPQVESCRRAELKNAKQSSTELRLCVLSRAVQPIITRLRHRRPGDHCADRASCPSQNGVHFRGRTVVCGARAHRHTRPRRPSAADDRCELRCRCAARVPAARPPLRALTAPAAVCARPYICRRASAPWT